MKTSAHPVKSSAVSPKCLDMASHSDDNTRSIVSSLSSTLRPSTLKSVDRTRSNSSTDRKSVCRSQLRPLETRKSPFTFEIFSSMFHCSVFITWQAADDTVP